MTAVSPYAPPGRDKKSHVATAATGAVGFVLLIFKFWSSPGSIIQRLPVGLKSKLAVVLQIILQSVKGFKDRLLINDNGGEGSEHQQVSNAGIVSQVTTKAFDPDPSASDYTGGASEVDNDDEKEEPEAVAIVRRNQRQIQAVLRYWFGQYAPDQAAKKLWMVSAQNTAWRQQIDEEIVDQFGETLFELTVVTDQTWSQWCGDSELYGYQGKIAAIIVLDQFSRHIMRFKQEASFEQLTADDMHFLQMLPPQQAMDRMAFKTSQLFIDEHAMEIASGVIPPPMYIFSLMPFRHAKMLEMVDYVRMQIDASQELQQQYDAMLSRFRKATNRRMALLQDESRRTGTGKDDFGNVDILEHVAFNPTNMDGVAEHSVYQAIRVFLEERGVHRVLDGANGEHATTPVIISLSGGVDSMVIAAVLSHLASSGKYRLDVTAVHIDYANRPESAAEAAFVESYCKQLGISSLCRRIDEVTRGDTARDEYEQVSRTVRYDFYRETVKDCLQKQSENGNKPVVGVILGHHRGDLRENVLSNAHKGSGPLDLSGMAAVSQNDGVTLYRPLLSLEKPAIYEYAHKYGIPYFKDTTPHWSTRGKLRSKLLPLLEEIYGEGSMNNLSNLAIESDECRALMQGAVMGPFLDQMEYSPMGISFETAKWNDQGHFFWKFVLREALHSCRIGMFTDKSVESFMERMQATKIREGWLQCRKDCGVYLRQDGRVFVLYSANFPWRKADIYDTGVQTVGYTPEEAVQIGPWCVSATINEDDKDTEQHLARKAIAGVQGLMSGSIEYYLQVPTLPKDEGYEPSPLVFTTFNKSSRPKAWKGLDIKIQDALPLVGNNVEAVKALQDPVGCGAVHTDSAGKQVTNPILLVKVMMRLATLDSST